MSFVNPGSVELYLGIVARSCPAKIETETSDSLRCIAHLPGDVSNIPYLQHTGISTLPFRCLIWVPGIQTGPGGLKAPSLPEILTRTTVPIES